MGDQARTKPLDGIRVLDLTHVLAGPYATLLLALNGAEVIKIEPPESGELYRRLVMKTKEGRSVDHLMGYLNRGKKGLTLNLRSPEGKAMFRDLVKISDIVIENFSATTMKRLGFDYAALKEINSRIVYTSISGFGHDDIYPGPYTDRPAFNLIAQAMSGVMDITGQADGPPIPSGVSIGDFVAGIFAVSGTLLALRHRDLTGIGQHVDISMYDSMASFSQRAISRYFLAGELVTRGNDNRENPMGTFRVADGYVVMTTMGDAMWERFCKLIDRPEWQDDPQFNPDNARGKLYESVIRPALEEWAKEKTRNEVVERFQLADLPAAPVQNAKDLFDCPQLRARSMIQEFDDPHRGPLAFTGNPIKLSAVAETPATPAPVLGGNNEQILADLLGLSTDRIGALKTQKII